MADGDRAEDLPAARAHRSGHARPDRRRPAREERMGGAVEARALAARAHVRKDADDPGRVDVLRGAPARSRERPRAPVREPRGVGVAPEGAGDGEGRPGQAARRLGHRAQDLVHVARGVDRGGHLGQRPDPLDRLAELLCARLDDALELRGVALERRLLLGHPALELADLHGATQRRDQVLAVERLLHVVVRAGAQRSHRKVVLPVPGDEQRGRVGPEDADLVQQREPVHARHLDVGHDDIVVGGEDALERGGGGVAHVHVRIRHAQPQRLGQRLEEGAVVVHHEHGDARRHGAPASAGVPPGARGSWMRNVAPRSGTRWSAIVPPWSLTIP